MRPVRFSVAYGNEWPVCLAGVTEPGGAGPSAERERRTGRKVLQETSPSRFLRLQPRLSSFGPGQSPPSSAAWREDVRGSGTSSGWIAVAFLKPKPCLSWVSRALPAGLNPDYCSLLVRSLALGGAGPARHCGAHTSALPDRSPGRRRGRISLRLSRRIPPSLVPSPPGGVSPRAGAGASGFIAGTGAAGGAVCGKCSSNDAPGGFRCGSEMGHSSRGVFQHSPAAAWESRGWGMAPCNL